MNTVKHVVTKVIGKPYWNYMWCVDVEADSWGSIQKTTAYFDTEKEALKLTVGYEFEG